MICIVTLVVALLMLTAPVPYARITQVHVAISMHDSGTFSETFGATFTELWRDGKETDQQVAADWLALAAFLLVYGWFGPWRRRWWLRTCEALVLVTAFGVVEFRHFDIMRLGTYDSLIGSLLFDTCVVVFTCVHLFGIVVRNMLPLDETTGDANEVKSG